MDWNFDTIIGWAFALSFPALWLGGYVYLKIQNDGEGKEGSRAWVGTVTFFILIGSWALPGTIFLIEKYFTVDLELYATRAFESENANCDEYGSLSDDQVRQIRRDAPEGYKVFVEEKIELENRKLGLKWNDCVSEHIAEIERKREVLAKTDPDYLPPGKRKITVFFIDPRTKQYRVIPREN